MAVRRPTALLIAAATFAAAPVLGLTGTATAGTPTAASTGFAAQTQRAGLTAAQAGRLQAQVDSCVAESGGEQVSANKVLVPGGSLVIRAPGQAYARDLAGRSKAPVKPACPYGHLCIWANGNAFDYYACGYFHLPDLVGNGTWVNNQAPGTVARFSSMAGRELWNTGPAYSSGTADWTLVGYVRPC
ncbi:hypothetical protein ADK76_37210 [Streptomyces griseoflavus]|uniref:hypothetical protein n=1 Tax=Streptomyces rimosus TaxID=1927 RepID=UPI0006C5A6D6|nr:hypothetical protein [Streptomyces rimosus]KOG51189.1 hypothetical protein ADK76_37210 [Streptomyces griseoflavus]